MLSGVKHIASGCVLPRPPVVGLCALWRGHRRGWRGDQPHWPPGGVSSMGYPSQHTQLLVMITHIDHTHLTILSNVTLIDSTRYSEPHPLNDT